MDRSNCESAGQLEPQWNASSVAESGARVHVFALWTDDIYGYDLSLPNAVGLTITSSYQKNPNAIYKAAIKDYVANLRGFVTGYAASRPSAIAQDDIDVVNLSGFVPFGSAKDPKSL